ncbi:hypothetical protein KHA96_16690 [Bacillus sp. FJAT-49711]|nr:hypothetical protein [Bacillus sp. FJAT-49711]
MGEHYVVKPRLKRNDLLNNDDIWNAVIAVISEYEYPSDNKMENDLYTVFQYYSELESGGHESLLTWFSEFIEEKGIENYLKELIGVLEIIGAHDYAAIEKKYGEEMWRLFIALESEKIDENEFYKVIQKADDEYYDLDGKLGELLETYFVSIHTEVIDVVEA